MTGALALYAGINGALFLAFLGETKKPAEAAGMVAVFNLWIVAGVIESVGKLVGRRAK